MRFLMASIVASALVFVPVTSASAASPEENYLVPVSAESLVRNSIEDTSLVSANNLVVSLTASEVKALDAKGITPTPTDQLVYPSSWVDYTEQPVEGWALDRVDQVVNTPTNTLRRNATGAGVDIYVVDSGIYRNHPEFTGRIKEGFSTIADGKDDCLGHGTRVASAAAGTTTGIAPEASIIPVRIFPCDGPSETENTIRALSWIVQDHQAGVPAVANLSYEASASPASDAAVEALLADGIAVAVAAGNKNTDACEVSPARVPGALTVGAISQQDELTTFSNSGPCVDLYAPGFWVRTADRQDSYTVSAGTSYATPLAAGALALYLSKYPTATYAEATAYILKTASAGVVKDVDHPKDNFLLLRTGIIDDPAAPVRDAVTPVYSSFSSAILGGPGSLSEQVGKQVPAATRIGGVDRFETSAQISASTFTNNTKRVYVASGETFPDALSAAALGGSSASPVLLSAKETLPSSVQAELLRLNPERITLVGGTGTLSANVEKSVSNLFPGRVDRIAGTDRFDTSALLVRDYFWQADTVYVASGENFPDALGASAVAGNLNAPLLLVGKSTVSSVVANTLGGLRPKKIVLVGGVDRISEDTLLAVQRTSGARVERIAGVDRYETTRLLVEELPKSSRVIVASGENFPDALAGGAVAGSLKIPLLLSPKSGLTDSVRAYVN